MHYKYTTREILKSFLTCIVSEVLGEDPTPGKDCVYWSAPHSRVPLKIEPVDCKLTLLIPDWDEEIETGVKFCPSGWTKLHAYEWESVSPDMRESVARRRRSAP